MQNQQQLKANLPMCQSNYSKVNNVQCSYSLQKWFNILPFKTGFQLIQKAEKFLSIQERRNLNSALKSCSQQPLCFPTAIAVVLDGAHSPSEEKTNPCMEAGGVFLLRAPDQAPEPEATVCKEEVICLACCCFHRWRSSLNSFLN